MNTKHTDSNNRSNLGQVENKLDLFPMTTKHTDSVEAIVEEINQMIPCLDSYCDKHGTTVGGAHPETGEQEPLQCEYCYRERFPILDRIRTTLQANQSQQVEEAVRKERERIIAVIEDVDATEGAWREALTGFKKVLVSTITPNHQEHSHYHWNERVQAIAKRVGDDIRSQESKHQD